MTPFASSSNARWKYSNQSFQLMILHLCSWTSNSWISRSKTSWLAMEILFRLSVNFSFVSTS